MKRKASAGATVAVVVVAGVACSGEVESPVGRSFVDAPADHVAWGLHTNIREEGSLRARVYGDTAYTWEDEGRMLLFPMEAHLFGKHGARTALLTADEGEIDTNTNRMVARGSVVLVTLPDNRRLLTEELHYDPRLGQIWSDAGTVMYDGNTRVEGSGFRSTEDLTDIQIFGSTGENLEVQL